MVLILLACFTGYLLPWDQLAYWAVTIGSNIAASSRELTDLLGITGWFDVGGFLHDPAREAARFLAAVIADLEDHKPAS